MFGSLLKFPGHPESSAAASKLLDEPFSARGIQSHIRTLCPHGPTTPGMKIVSMVNIESASA
jgi:hypothetical protein